MMTVKEAVAHMREMMQAMYEGRTVRQPEEFKRDLEALRVAIEALEEEQQ